MIGGPQKRGPRHRSGGSRGPKVDTLGRRIDRQAKSSPVSFQAFVAVRVGLGHVLARAKARFEAFDRDDRSVETFPTQSAAAAASFGGER